MRLGDAVRELRENRAFSKEEFAGKARIKLDTLKALEGNRRTPRHATIRAVAKALDLTPEALKEYAARNGFPAVTEHGDAVVAPDEHPLYRRLKQITRITIDRTNVVREAGTAPAVTLADGLYVRRDVEDEIFGSLRDPEADWSLMVIDGEPGTGKSSMLWALQRRLAAEIGEAWLVDAAELAELFGYRAGSHQILDSEYLRLFKQMSQAGRRTFLLIDTVDVVLNARGLDTELISLLTELAAVGVTIVVASRPGEAKQLRALSPRIIRIFDYSDHEFQIAVDAYARAFVEHGQRLTPEEHAQRILEAVAQGYPIREICRNPLTLRMLYAIYAPEDINVFEVDVVSLYREFWRRRVEADIRTNDGQGRAADLDLSPLATRIALCMLVEGIPELPLGLLGRELSAARLPKEGLHVLASRGVVRISEFGRERLVSFFHQTFFEHAAAVGILRLGGAGALRGLADRWVQYQGNLFLGAVLERALVLAEDELHPVRLEAERIIQRLAEHGPAGMSVLMYLFVHRRSIPDDAAATVQRRVAAGDTLLVERLLGLAGNAIRARRLALIKLLGSTVASANSRWLRRAFELLLRFSLPDVSEVATAVKSSGVGNTILGGSDKFPQARGLYLRFLKQYFAHDPNWVVSELGLLLSDAVERRAGDTALEVLEGLQQFCPIHRGLAAALERQMRLRLELDERLRISARVALEFGRLFFAEWKLSGTSAQDIFDELDTQAHRGLYLNARLNGLAELLLESSPKDVLVAFRRSGMMREANVRVMLGRITWTRLIPALLERWDPAVSGSVLRQMSEIAGDIFSRHPGTHAQCLYHVLRNVQVDARIFERLLGVPALQSPILWLDPDALGSRLIEATAKGIQGAEAAFVELQRDPQRHKRLAHIVLIQVKLDSPSEEISQIGVALAIQVQEPEALLECLKHCHSAAPDWSMLLPHLRAMIGKLRNNGNVRIRRTAIGIEAELSRLRFEPAITWPYLIGRAEGERDDWNQALLVRALDWLIVDDPDSRDARLEWLARFGANRGPKTREAILEIFDRLSDSDAAVAVKFIDQLFSLAFKDAPDGSILGHLSGPLFALHSSKDPRTPELALRLIYQCAPLPTQTCRKVCGKFRRLFSLIVQGIPEAKREELLRLVPGLNRYLARMIVEAVTASGVPNLSTKLQAIMENPDTAAEIVTLSGRFLQRELRVGGLDKWPELYSRIEVT